MYRTTHSTRSQRCGMVGAAGGAGPPLKVYYTSGGRVQLGKNHRVETEGVYSDRLGPRWDLRSSADGGSARRPRRQLSQERSTHLREGDNRSAVKCGARAWVHGDSVKLSSGPTTSGEGTGCYVLDSIGAEGGAPTLRRRRIGGPTSAPQTVGIAPLPLGTVHWVSI